jgi:sugar/nucleoside kinase (ribokinase family)
VIALLGNIARDLRPGLAPQPGGGPIHGARALRRLGVPARIFGRCARKDREALFDPLLRVGVDAQYVPGEATAWFEFTYDGERREMHVAAAGDVWQPSDVPPLPTDIRWVHVSPLLRSDFPTETVVALTKGRHVLLDGQGLVRAAQVGPLVLDADYDPEVLRHVRALKLSEEEAEVLGDPGELPVPEVLVTNGSRGTTVYFEGRAEEVSAEAVEADPTGGGDAFASAYVAARAVGLSPVDAAQHAVNLVSALLKGD